MGWATKLKRLFPALKGASAEPVHELPPWTLADASQMDAFLASTTGERLLGRMRYDVTCRCLDPRDMDANALAEWRAIAWVISGMVSMSDQEYWKFRDKEYVEENYGEEADYDFPAE